MIHRIAVIIVTALVSEAAAMHTRQSVGQSTSERISENNYPVETHNVRTSDGYILTLFRIPYSPRLQNQNEHRPGAFLHHGLLSSSDSWILNGPDNALAYVLADAGFDVWLGNARGNTYSMKHESLSTSQPSFWDFSWHEIGVYDVSASVDYILETTSESGLHYVGHSMGATAFFVLMSVRPEYNAKIKTAHLLGPVAFTSHFLSFVMTLGAPFVGHPSPMSDLLQNMEFLSYRRSSWLHAIGCSEVSPFKPAFWKVLMLIFGRHSTHFNTTVIPDLCETHPAGTSTTVYTHFVQEYVSGHFRRFDHGPVKNLLKYKQITPPDYNLSNIVAPVRLYYSDNDFLAVGPDVKRAEVQLPNVVESFHIPYPDWNHIDFLFAIDAKETLYDRIINAAKNFEATGNQ